MEEEERPVKRQKTTDTATVTDMSKTDAQGAQTSAQSEVPPLDSQNDLEAPPPQPSNSPDARDSDEPPTSPDGHIESVRDAYPTTINPSDPPISKSQLKKIRRNQAWEAGREYRKTRRKEKIQAKREKKRAARATDTAQEGDPSDPSLASANGATNNGALVDDAATNEVPTKGLSNNGTSAGGRPAKKEHRRAVQLPVTLILDCGFDDLMLPKEIISLGSQLTRAYSDNVRARYRAHLVLSSFGGRLKERFDTVLSKQHEGWKFVKFTAESFVEASHDASTMMKGERGGQLAGAFDPLPAADRDAEGEIVYLTSDSPDTLETLKPNSTYIIGALVDKNRHKGICYKTAMDKGIKTAKLPIGEYMQMNSRFVLATNHVVEIMLRWLECGDWGEAFERVVPKRKGGVLRENRRETVE